MGEIYLLRNTAVILYKQPSPFLLTVLYKVPDIESVIPSGDIFRVLDIVLASPLVESP